MFRDVLDQVNKYIKEHIYTLTGHELYDLKKGFYEKSVEYMGHSQNLTGITELILNMFFTHFVSELNLPYSIERTKKIAGLNGRKNEIDIVLINEIGLVKYGISVKRELGLAGWKDHETNTPLYKELKERYGCQNNLIQDFFRLDNIKRGPNGYFPSVTIFFEDVSPQYHGIMRRIENDHPYYRYIVLKQHKNSLFEDLKEKLKISLHSS